MKMTLVKSDNYLNTLVNAIKALMEENNITEIPMEGTEYGDRGGWTKIVLKDGEVKYQSKHFSENTFFSVNGIHRWDIVTLQNVIYHKVEEMFVKEY